MVDLGGYVIILVETNDKRVKLYGGKICVFFLIRNDLMTSIQAPLLTRQTWRWRTKSWK